MLHDGVHQHAHLKKQHVSLCVEDSPLHPLRPTKRLSHREVTTAAPRGEISSDSRVQAPPHPQSLNPVCEMNTVGMPWPLNTARNLNPCLQLYARLEHESSSCDYVESARENRVLKVYWWGFCDAILCALKIQSVRAFFSSTAPAFHHSVKISTRHL